jgi:hypothetical protein
MADTSAYFAVEHAAVVPELIGQPLAPRWRRGLALAIDGFLLLIPTALLSLAVAFGLLRREDPPAFRAIWEYESTDPQVRQRAYRDLAPLLARLEAPGLPAAVAAAVEEHDLERAGALLEGYKVEISVKIGEALEPPLRPKEVRLEVAKLLPTPVRILLFYGTWLLYFTVLTRRGATLGKKLLGLRIVRLDGARLSWLDSLERSAAYAEVLGTLGFALLALWRSPNRRLPHDRIAETVVLRARRAAPPTAPAETPTSEGADTPERVK